jgi:phage terminase Nu1 subunit (DNA packaging protein)
MKGLSVVSGKQLRSEANVVPSERPNELLDRAKATAMAVKQHAEEHTRECVEACSSLAREISDVIDTVVGTLRRKTAEREVSHLQH